MTLTGTVTDMEEFARAYEQLIACITDLHSLEALHLLERMGKVITLNVDIKTAYANWVRGMPEHAQAIEEILRHEGYGPALDGC